MVFYSSASPVLQWFATPVRVKLGSGSDAGILVTSVRMSGCVLDELRYRYVLTTFLSSERSALGLAGSHSSAVVRLQRYSQVLNLNLVAAVIKPSGGVSRGDLRERLLHRFEESFVGARSELS